jgi:hypothetical protein
VGPGARVGVDEVEVLGDPVEPGLDRRVAHSEDPLHLLDGAVRPHERGHEHLVVGAELRQLRRLELPLDRGATAGTLRSGVRPEDAAMMLHGVFLAAIDGDDPHRTGRLLDLLAAALSTPAS